MRLSITLAAPAAFDSTADAARYGRIRTDAGRLLDWRESGEKKRIMHPIESLRIDEDEIELGVFAVPEMSLSSARAGMTAHSVVVTVRTAETVRFLAPAYEEWVRYSREDDAICGGPQDDLAEAGYPALHQLSGMPDLLKTVLGSYLLDEFLGKLTWDGSRPIKFWLDEITHCESDGDAIRLFGVCYSRGR